MATQLDFLKAKVQAYKKTLDGKSAKEKDGLVSVLVAQQFNGFVEEIKKESPDAASHLPQPITWDGPAGRMLQKSDVKFLELEMMLNQVIAVLDVLRADH